MFFRSRAVKALVFANILSVFGFSPTAFADPTLLKRFFYPGSYGFAITNDESVMYASGNGNDIRVWDFQKQIEFISLAGQGSAPGDLMITPDQTRLIAVSGANVVSYGVNRPPSSGGLYWKNSGHFEGHSAVSHDSKFVATTDGDTHDVLVMTVAKGDPVFRLKGHTDMTRSLHFSDDGKTLVSAGWDQSVHVWDLTNGSEKFCLCGIGKGGTITVRLAPNDAGILISSSRSGLGLYSLETGQLITSYPGVSEFVRELNYSADGKRIVAAVNDATILVWDAASGQPQLTIDVAKGKPASNENTAAFSPDGRFILSAGYVTSAALWDAQTGALIEHWTQPDAIASLARFTPTGTAIMTYSELWNGSHFDFWALPN